MKRTVALLCCLVLIFSLTGSPAFADSEWTGIVEVVCVEGCTVALRADGSVLYAGNPAYPAAREVESWSDVEWITTQDNGAYLVGYTYDSRVYLSLLADPEDWSGPVFGQEDVFDWTQVLSVLIRQDLCFGLRFDGSFYWAALSDSAAEAVRATDEWPPVWRIWTDGWSLILALSQDGDFLCNDEATLLERCCYWGGDPEGMDAWQRIYDIWCGNYGIYAIREDRVIGVNCPGWDRVASLSVGSDSIFGLRYDGTVAAEFYEGVSEHDPRIKQVGEWEDIEQLGFDGWMRYVPVGLRSDGTIAAVTTYDGVEPYGEWDFRGWSDVTALYSGSDYSLGLLSDGTLMATGGEFGYLDYIREVARWRDVSQVYPAIGGESTDHIVALRSDGTLLAAGDDSFGQCRVS